MQKTIPFVSILCILFSCTQPVAYQNNIDNLTFKVYLNPSFIESGVIALSKIDSIYEMEILLLEIQRHDRPSDTFYYKKTALLENQFDNFKTGVIEKIRIDQPKQQEGIRDGMTVGFMVITNSDTSSLYFRNPDINTNTIGYEITKTAMNHCRSIIMDSIIHDYFDDVESYMDDSKPSIHRTDNRAINKLREHEYSKPLK